MEEFNKLNEVYAGYSWDINANKDMKTEYESLLKKQREIYGNLQQKKLEIKKTSDIQQSNNNYSCLMIDEYIHKNNEIKVDKLQECIEIEKNSAKSYLNAISAIYRQACSSISKF